MLATAEQVAFDGAFGQAGDRGDLGNRQFFKVVQGQEHALHRWQRLDRGMQLALVFALRMGGLQVVAVTDVVEQGHAVSILSRFSQRNTLALQMAARNRVSDLPDPRFQWTVEAVLVQATMRAKEGLLAQLAGIFRMANHALDHVPTQTLVLTHQLFERTRAIGEHGFDKPAVKVRIGIHPSSDTPGAGSVASLGQKTFYGQAATGRATAVSLSLNGKYKRTASHHPHKGFPMNFELLIPITFFICITYAIKVVMDARVRKQLVSSNGSPELVQSIMANDESNRRLSSLRWGITMVALAIGFGIVQGAGWTEVNPGVIALLVGALGLGNLAFYMLSRKLG